MKEPGKIPANWLNKVCFILKSGDVKTYAITLRARREFEALFVEKFTEEMLPILHEVLSTGAYTDARQVFGMKPEGITYEFLFPYEGRRMYSKIDLVNGKLFVCIFSMHEQGKDDIEHGRFL